MRVVVPYAAADPKTRLADTLDVDERAAFARAMLDDVLTAVRGAGATPELLTTGPVAVEGPVTIDDRPLSEAVNAILAESAEPVAVVMADLPLATPAALGRLFSSTGEVVITAGRAGGTNALVVRHPDFRVDYHGTSFLDHLAAAREVGASVREIDSYRLATDVDDPSDLVEVLVHGGGRARRWLVDAGFHVEVATGRVGLGRD